MAKAVQDVMNQDIHGISRICSTLGERGQTLGI